MTYYIIDLILYPKHEKLRTKEFFDGICIHPKLPNWWSCRVWPLKNEFKLVVQDILPLQIHDTIEIFNTPKRALGHMVIKDIIHESN